MGESLTGYEASIPGDGKIGELIRSYDWSQTSLGAIANWSPSLRNAISIVLGSRYPMLIWWGEELLNFYNDAFIPILGARHPNALGQPAPEVWQEAWDILTPQVEAVFKQERSSLNEALMFVLERNGYLEETYFTYSYSPIFDETGKVGGLLGVSVEDTQRVLSDRRIQTLRELTESTLEAKTVESAGETAIATLGNNLLSGGVWSEPSKLAVVLPIGTLEPAVSGFLIAGVSPLRGCLKSQAGMRSLNIGFVRSSVASHNV